MQKVSGAWNNVSKQFKTTLTQKVAQFVVFEVTIHILM